MVSHKDLWLWEVVYACFFYNTSPSWSFSWAVYCVFSVVLICASSYIGSTDGFVLMRAQLRCDNIAFSQLFFHVRLSVAFLLLVCVLEFFAVFPKRRCVALLELALADDWSYVFSRKHDAAIRPGNDTELWCVNSAAFLRNLKFDQSLSTINWRTDA